jgi:hypothetical protein
MADGTISPELDCVKHCWTCGQSKSLSEFNKSSSTRDGLQTRCRACGKIACRDWYGKNKDTERHKARKRSRVRGPIDRERNRLWALANPEKARYHSRKKLLGKKYNMTIEEHDALFASQGSVCGACGSPEPNSKKGWSTDHCHKTGVVRGIVCHHCNIGIGHAKDSVETIRSWIAYLERSRDVATS